MAALRVIADDHRVVADAETAHRPGELFGSQQHPAWMTRRGWGSGQIARPVAVHRAGKVAVQIVLARIALERETTIDDAHVRVAQLRGRLLGRPEEVRTREGAHVSDFSRANVA